MLVRVALTAGLLCLAGPALAKEAKVPGKLLGKVFFVAEKPKDVDPESLVRQFEKSQPKTELKRGKAKTWQTAAVAFFRKESVQGPVTIWIYDKADKDAIRSKEPTHEFSVDSQPKKVFIHDLDFDPDQGYNPNHTYIVHIGQIISKKERIYATGEITLKK